MAWQELKAGECSGCGLPLVETTDPANFRAYEAESIPCHACATRDRAADVRRDQEKSSGREYGLRWAIRKVKGVAHG